ncbi:MAG: response regulator [Thermodesulfovibrionales bacterium]|nr:response regulator [Thermodesulfovibrionales bacterium]
MKILIIDDDILSLKLLSQLSKKAGDVEAVCFQTPIEALKWAQDNEPELVLVDYTMPDMNGIDFIRKFKTIPKRATIPIIMITGVAENAIRYEALLSGANDFLTKPVDSTEFIARVRNMLALSEYQKMLSDRAEWLQNEVKKATQEIILREIETIYCLSRATELRDPETGEHILRMSNYSHHIAENLGLNPNDQELLLKIAPMHDIGKVGIADSILLKPDKLTEEEYKTMTTHTIIGYNILKDSRSDVLREASFIALYHHERYDGKGYPMGLKGEEIPLFSRIVAVADVFDALTSVRPYKKAWEVEEACKYLKSVAGSQFDAACVDAFFKNWQRVIDIKNRYPNQ